MPTLSAEALDTLTVEQLKKLAKTQGVEIADDAKKTDLVAALSAPDPAAEGPQADIAEPDATKEKTKELPDGRVEARRPVSEVNAEGDWRDPFSGLLVYHGQHDNPANGARVDVPADRRRRKSAAGLVYVPVEAGDDVVLIRDEVA